MEEAVAYTIDGKPLTLKEYKEKLDRALERVKNGEYTTQKWKIGRIKTYFETKPSAIPSLKSKKQRLQINLPNQNRLTF